MTPADRARLLQDHLCEREHTLRLPSEPRMLEREIRNRLVNACDEGILAMKPHEIYAQLKLSDSPLDRRPEYKGIYGGEKDLKRTGKRPCFRRRDAYDFELCFPERDDREARLPRFVRFDLNQPAHDNESRGLRCHMHPGHDDLIAPAPLMSPLELLDLFLSSELALPEEPRMA
jgi:hypothetical protein